MMIDRHRVFVGIQGFDEVEAPPTLYRSLWLYQECLTKSAPVICHCPTSRRVTGPRRNSERRRRHVKVASHVMISVSLLMPMAFEVAHRFNVYVSSSARSVDKRWPQTASHRLTQCASHRHPSFIRVMRVVVVPMWHLSRLHVRERSC